MGKILWTCWTACFLLCCWIPVTTASLSPVMLLGSLPFILDGVLMVMFRILFFVSLAFKVVSCYLKTQALFGYHRSLTLFCLYSGSIWISSELKGLNDDCEHFESFPPGHLYSSKEGGLRRWYNPLWFSEAIPSTPYDPLVLRRAFENVMFKI